MPSSISKADSPLPAGHLYGFARVLEEPIAALVDGAREVRRAPTDYSTSRLLTTLNTLATGNPPTAEEATNLRAVIHTVEASTNDHAKAALALLRHRFSPHLLSSQLVPDGVSAQALTFDSPAASNFLTPENYRNALWEMRGRFTTTDLIAEAKGVSDRFEMPWSAKVLLQRFELPGSLEEVNCFKANGLNWCLFPRKLSIPWLGAMYGLLYALKIPCMQPEFFVPNIHTNRTEYGTENDVFRTGVALDVPGGWLRLEKLNSLLEKNRINIDPTRAANIVLALKHVAYMLRKNGLCATGWDLAVNIGDQTDNTLVRIIDPSKIEIMNARSAFRCFNHPDGYNPEPDLSKYSARGPYIPDPSLMRWGLLASKSYRRAGGLMQEVVSHLLDKAYLPSVHSEQYAEALAYHFIIMLSNYENYVSSLAAYTSGDEQAYWQRHTDTNVAIEVEHSAVVSIFADYLDQFGTDGLVVFAALVLPSLLRDLQSDITKTREVLASLYAELNEKEGDFASSPGGKSDYWEQWWTNSRKIPGSSNESGGGSSAPPGPGFGLGCGFSTPSSGNVASPVISVGGAAKFSGALPVGGANILGASAMSTRVTLPPPVLTPPIILL